MDTSQSQTWRPLSAILTPDEKGDAEFVHLISLLLCRDEDLAQQQSALISLNSGVWYAGDSLYFCQLPSVKNWNKAKFKLDFNDRLNKKTVIKRLILITPFHKSDVPTSFQHFTEQLCEKLGKQCKLERWWDAEYLKTKLLEITPLALRYYPDLLPNGIQRHKNIAQKRQRYDQEFLKLYGKIQFVGMSVYKEEASNSVEMDKIYIPLRVVAEGATDDEQGQIDPLTLLKPGERHVILGDPGSGKSTLLRFLALAGRYPKLIQRYGATADDRLPLLVILRQYAEELQKRPKLNLLDYLGESNRRQLDISEIGQEFLEYYLYAGQAILLFDGVDELGNPDLKAFVREQIVALLQRYPNNTVLITSRIVGYDKELRYDDFGFSHHWVAQLSLDNIERFVNDWYLARIDSRVEREQHATDLVRIVSAEGSQAIQELAGNPLLLTIICLVHRIDAVLPDERVVLYQKCTETLLNTWHAWKFHSRENRSRNKVERRNRARMEAIAYWMHTDEDQGDSAQRAVVSYAELRVFLTEYIQDIEKPANDDPQVLAEQFLHFIKERAGLLIEVGDEMYSFVHLTFQEYLAATYLRKSGERGGMVVIWQIIENRCDVNRWHEVIRLLIGALERTDSQEFLLENILPFPEAEGYLSRALLVGGCLIDSIDAAEEMHEDIVTALLRVSLLADDLDDLRKPLRMLRIWQNRGPENRAVLGELSRKLDEEARLAEQDDFRVGLALNLISLGWSTEELSEVCDRLDNPDTFEGQVYRECILGKVNIFQSVFERDLLQAVLIQFTLANQNSNYIASIISVLCFTNIHPSFSLFLTSIYSSIEGPFSHLLSNYLLITEYKVWDRALKRARIRVLNRSNSLDQTLNRALDQVRDRTRGRARDRELARKLARDQVRDQVRDRAWDQVRDQVRNQVRDSTSGFNRIRQQAIRNTTISFWDIVIEQPELYSPVLDIICDLLDLKPRSQWWEALRVGALPQVPKRITLTDPNIWQATIEAFSSNQAEETDCLHAASQLLLDVWLWLHKVHTNAEESPFRRLAQLTKEHSHPALQIAHCLRDIAYGDEARADDLVAMVKSEDLGFRRFFEEAFWIDRVK